MDNCVMMLLYIVHFVLSRILNMYRKKNTNTPTNRAYYWIGCKTDANKEEGRRLLNISFMGFDKMLPLSIQFNYLVNNLALDSISMQQQIKKNVFLSFRDIFCVCVKNMFCVDFLLFFFSVLKKMKYLMYTNK